MRSRQERKSCQEKWWMMRTKKNPDTVRESLPRSRMPSVFAAASDVDNTSLINLLAVKRGHGIMCFDAVAAFGQAPETELIFIEAPEEHRAVVGQHVLWQCLKVREGRRKGARAWQDHFIETLLSRDCPGSFKQSLRSPTIFTQVILKLLWTCMSMTGS